jgi:DNA-binding transcriptional MerR regulator
MRKSADPFRTISDDSAWLDAPTHVLRFWDSTFPQVKPGKHAGGRRYYRPEDMLLLGGIKQLLHNDGITIKGVQKILKEQGVKHVSSLSHDIGDGGKAPKAEKPAPVAAPPKAEETPQDTSPATEAPLAPLRLTPNDATSPPVVPADTRVNDGTFAAEDTPWAKPADPSTPTPPPADAPTGEYVRRFGFVADEAGASNDAADETPSAADLGHLRPGPVARLVYRGRDDTPIFPHRSYTPATLAEIQIVAEKLRAMSRTN